VQAVGGAKASESLETDLVGLEMGRHITLGEESTSLISPHINQVRCMLNCISRRWYNLSIRRHRRIHAPYLRVLDSILSG